MIFVGNKCGRLEQLQEQWLQFCALVGGQLVLLHCIACVSVGSFCIMWGLMQLVKVTGLFCFLGDVCKGLVCFLQVFLKRSGRLQVPLF